MVVLETQTCNENAISFYRKNVFEIIGFDFYAYTNSDPEQHEVRLEIGKRLKSSGCVKSEMPVEIRIRTEGMRINTSEQEKPVSKRDYLLQPYNAGIEMKSGTYQIMLSVTYFVCLCFIRVKLPILVFGMACILFCLFYFVLACILIYRLAPKTFRLRI